MQRRATGQSRGPNTLEKQHMGWIKDRMICAACGAHGFVICHHAMGSTFKVRVGCERLQIGHLFILGLCPNCDGIVTNGSRRAFTDQFGPQCDLWLIQAEDCPLELPTNYIAGIAQCGR